MLEVFGNNSIRCILRVRRGDCVPSAAGILLVQRRLRWFGHAARRPEGELTKDLLLPTPPRTWRRRAGGQLKTWATTIKADLEPISGPRVFGHARWRKDWVKVFSEVAQDRPRRGQRDWWYRLNPPRVNADASTSILGKSLRGRSNEKLPLQWLTDYRPLYASALNIS